MKDKTPIQTAIDIFTKRAKETISSAYYETEVLKSLLPYEKEFMQEVFQSGKKVGFDEGVTGDPSTSHPYIETIYSQYENTKP
jgi:hypothetical protein